MTENLDKEYQRLDSLYGARVELSGVTAEPEMPEPATWIRFISREDGLQIVLRGVSWRDEPAIRWYLMKRLQHEINVRAEALAR